MDLDKIKQANTKYLGKHIVYEKEMESTQDRAKEIWEIPVKNGTVIITDLQTKGKGTKGREWYTSKEKNITMTLIWYPECSIEKMQGLTIEIAEVIVETIQELYQITMQIKEPNDVLLHGKKIAGILTESTTYQSKVKHLIIGIGLNINETEFSEETKAIATSLKQEFQREFEREEIVVAILEKLEKKLLELSK